MHFYTDNWDSFAKVFPQDRHIIGKRHTPAAEQTVATMAMVASAFASTFAQSLAEGNSFLKSFVMSLLSALQAAIPALLALIFGITSASPANIASLGTWGAIAFAALSATLMGMVDLAKSAVSEMNFFTGGPTNKAFSGLVKDGVRSHDSTRVNVAKDEFIVNNKAVLTGNNLEILDKMNSSNRDVYDILIDEIAKDEQKKLKLIRDANLIGNIGLHNVVNNIIVNKQITVQIDDEPLIRELQATNNRIDGLTNEIKQVKYAVQDKDLTVVNKVYADNIKIGRQKRLAGYSIA